MLLPSGLATDGHKEVVSVHESVDNGVDQWQQGVDCEGEVLDGHPSGEWHEGVVEDVEEGHLRGLLAKGDENGVQEIHELGQMVQISN